MTRVWTDLVHDWAHIRGPISCLNFVNSEKSMLTSNLLGGLLCLYEYVI